MGMPHDRIIVVALLDGHTVAEHYLYGLTLDDVVVNHAQGLKVLETLRMKFRYGTSVVLGFKSVPHDLPVNLVPHAVNNAVRRYEFV